MECSSTTLWAEQKLADGQTVSLIPHRRFPHVFHFISFVTHFIGYLLAITPGKTINSTAINMALCFGMTFISIVENAVAMTKKLVSGKSHRLCGALLTVACGTDCLAKVSKKSKFA